MHYEDPAGVYQCCSHDDKGHIRIKRYAALKGGQPMQGRAGRGPYLIVLYHDGSGVHHFPAALP